MVIVCILRTIQIFLVVFLRTFQKMNESRKMDASSLCCGENFLMQMKIMGKVVVVQPTLLAQMESYN